VVVAFDMNDPAIPERVRAEDQKQRSGGATGTPEGFYYKGTVYLMSSKLADPRDVVRVLFHEALGHYGLRGVFGKELKPLLQQVATMRKAQVEAKMKEYGLRGVSSVDRLTAAEEVLAEMAQTAPNIGFVRRAVATIKAWLRKHIPGFMGMKMTDDEIIATFILPARNYVLNGGPNGGPGGGVRFQRGESPKDQTQTPEFKRWFGDWEAVRDGRQFYNTVTLEGAKEKTPVASPRDTPIAGERATSANTGVSSFVRQTLKRVNPESVSKVVDADGKPLVVYHGTGAEISEFRPTGGGSLGSGIYFTDSPSAASMFAERKQLDGKNGNVMPVYLSAKRILDMDTASETEIGAFVASLPKTTDDLLAMGYPSKLANESGEFIDRDLARLQRNFSPRALDMALGDMATLKAVYDRAGYDAVARTSTGLIGEPAFKEWAVFSPTQVKSATGNNGDFDGDNPDIRFSRSIGDALADGVNNVKAMQLPAGYVVDDFMKSSGKLGWWHKTVGTQYDLAQRNPLFKRVFDSAQGFLNDVSLYATEAANEAPRMLPKLESLKDLAKSSISAADSKAIAAPIFEGTLMWARRDDGSLVRVDMDDEDTSPGVVFTPAELREQFDLSDDQIALYNEFRNATDKSLFQMGLADMLRFGGKDVDAVREQVLGAGNFGEALDVLGKELRDHAGKEPKRAAVLLDTMGKMVAKANKYQGLMDKGYAPLSRFGRHTLDVLDEDGKRVYFGLFETEREANKMARRMQANYPGARVSQGTVSEEEHKMFAGVSPETVELFGQMLGLEANGDEASDIAFQQYLKMAKASRSAMKRLIHRKGIAGFSEDPGRVLAGFVYSNARQTSAALNMGELAQAVADIPKGQGELKDHAVRLHEYVKNPQEEAQAFRGLLFAQYIGGSVASAIINTTQPFAVTMPWLSQFGGAASAAKQMGRAAKDAIKKDTGDKALDAALKRAEEEGIVSPQEVFQLQAQAAGRATLRSGDGTKSGDAMAAASNTLSKLGLAWGRLFGVAEQFNRRTTFIAAYRTAVEQGMGNPAAFAERAISETQFVYSKANKPRWARGAVGATLFTFKQYSVSYVELMHRMATQGGPEGKKAALLGLAILFMLGGAGGLPFAEDVDDLIDGIMQRMGYNFSSKQAKHDFFAGVLGEEMADFMVRGVSGVAGMPVDVSGRFGMGNLIPGTGLFVKKADSKQDFMELAGPAGDLVRRGIDSAEKLAMGDVFGARGALATAAPLAGQNVAKALEMANTGMYLDKKGRKVLDVDGYDAMAKAIGLQPNDIAKVQDAAFEQQRMVAVNRLREAEIADKWARGVFMSEPDVVAEARADVAQWNEDNPDSPIRVTMPQIARRVREMRLSKAERVAKAAPSEIRARVREELGVR
jgi:hypothetical protein